MSEQTRKLKTNMLNRLPSLDRRVTLILLIVVSFAQGQSRPTPRPKTVVLLKSESGILPILTGPPETVAMKSGYVVLDPGRSVGRHTTANHEEILVVLEGEGEMLFHDGSKMVLKAPMAAYCPPQTEHDVQNTGAAILRYVYVVANAE